MINEKYNKKIKRIFYSDVTNTTYIRYSHNLKGYDGVFTSVKELVGKRTPREIEESLK